MGDAETAWSDSEVQHLGLGLRLGFRFRLGLGFRFRLGFWLGFWFRLGTARFNILGKSTVGVQAQRQTNVRNMEAMDTDPVLNPGTGGVKQCHVQV